MGATSVQTAASSGSGRDEVEVTRIHCLSVDPIIVLSIALVAVWAAGTWFDGPGWIHLLLTAGVFLFVWRIVTRRRPDSGAAGR